MEHSDGFNQTQHTHPLTAKPSESEPTPSLGDESLSLRVFELNADAIVIVDEAGRIVRINQQTETLFGYTRKQLLGQPVERLLPTRLRRKHLQHRVHYASAPQARLMGSALALLGCRRDGSEFPVAVSLRPIQVGDEVLTISTIRDISMQRYLEHQVQTEGHARLALLAGVLEYVPCAISVVYGTDARLALANRRMATLWRAPWPVGQPFVDFLQTSHVDLLAPEGRTISQNAWAPMRALQQDSAISEEEVVIRRADGTIVPVLVSVAVLDPAVLDANVLQFRSSPTQPPVDSVASVSMIAYQDISTLKASTRFKDEFIALLTHELRTPMTLIQGYAQTLGRVRTNDATVGDEEWAQWQMEAREAIVQATARLAQLTEDLLEVSQVHSGNVPLHLEPEDLVALTRRVCARIQATAMQHQLHFTAEEEPLVALVDPRRLEQVVTQLLTNAVKFSPDGGEVVISLHRDQQTNSAVLAVRDRGIGIPAKRHSQIFERFVRAENAQQQGIPGRGLGLYLSRELVQRHGGHLRFESIEGQGSTFTMWIPLTNDDDL